jgi:NADH-quinone oxidoreductase subunit N
LALFLVVVASGTLADSIIVVMATIAGLSILVGSVGALRQRSYTRMLGFAGVTQAGYALIGAVVLNPTAAVFFATTYAIATTGTFLAAAAFRRTRPEWDGSIEGLAGLGRGAARATAISLTVLLVSLAGIPPLLGFWGKFQVFAGAITVSGRMFLVAGNPLLGWTYALLAVAGVVGSVVSLAYYGSVFQALFLADDSVVQASADVPEATVPDEREESSASSAVAVTAILVVVLGLVPLFLGMSSLMLPFTVR